MRLARQGPSPPAARGRTLAAAALSFFMAISATTAVNVALPPIGRDFGVGVSGLVWVVNAYSMVFAGLLLSCGALGDRIGVHVVFRYGLGLFAAGSAAGVLAPALPALVAAQALAGLGAAAVVPTSLTLISQAFVDTASRARAIAIWAAAGGAAIAVGPLLGGLLVTALSWRSVFGLNVVAGLVALLIARSVPAVAPERRERSLDLAGQVLAVLALGTLTFALVEGRTAGWTSGPVLTAAVTAVLAAAGFLLVESRASAPMLPLSLFRVPAFSAATGIGLLLNFAYYGQIFVLALYFQSVRGYSPLYAGLAFLPMTATVSVSNLVVGRLIPRTGNRLPLVAGVTLSSLGLLALALLDPRAPYGLMVAPLLAVGFGGGLAVPPMTAALLGAAPHAWLGVASGVLNSSRQAGGVIGVALFGSLIAGGGFGAGMRAALFVAAGALLLAALTAVRYVDRPPDRARGPWRFRAEGKGARAMTTPPSAGADGGPQPIDVGVARHIGTYSDAVATPGGQRWLHTSGTPGLRGDGSLPDDITEQSKLAWDNVLAALAAAGMGVADIVKVTSWLVDTRDTSAYTTVRAQVLGEARPASMLAIVPALVRPEIRVEVEVIAACPAERPT